MATKKQIAANRRNALKSTGPRTDRGKAFSRLNALRHGLRAKAGVLSPECLIELNQIRGEFLKSFQPQNREQIVLVEKMASARWSTLNWQRTETQFLSQHMDPLSQLRALDGFSQRQAGCQRAFIKASEQYRRATRATPPESRPTP